VRISFRGGTWVNDWVPTPGAELRWLKTRRTWTATIGSVRIATVGSNTIGGQLRLTIVGWTWGTSGTPSVPVRDLDEAAARIRRVLREVAAECRVILGEDSFSDGRGPLQ
jgi:hypothetical protein